MPKAYLTIDDGPSERFEDLIDSLSARFIPAIFFNRGDAMQKRPEAVIYGIKSGYHMANHAYSHKRASQLSLHAMREEIMRTERILDELYKRAQTPRLSKYFRFPYMDRGMGAFLIEPDDLQQEHETGHQYLVESGLGHVLRWPDMQAIEHKRALQDVLKAQGFVALPTPHVTIPWYGESEMACAIDSLCTFSTSDWALSPRHVGHHGFNTLDDLKHQIDQDPWLHNEQSHHIILVHDQADIFETTVALVDYLCAKGFDFLDFCDDSAQT